MASERVVITVKTYPQLSTKYGETVCTAGLRETDGSWVRLYPIPFRLLDLENRYKKWQIIETPLQKVTSDFRPESHNPIDPSTIRCVDELDTSDNWRLRRKLVFEKSIVHESLTSLIDDAHKNVRSLATMKPAEILDFTWEPDEREWNADRIELLRNRQDQGELFSDDNWKEAFKVIPKLPYKFRFVFRDVDGRVSKPQVLDWEVGMLFWKCRRGADSEERALELVRDKFMSQYAGRDMHFFLGTTKDRHLWASNPWLIIGLFYPPEVSQTEFDLGV